MCWHWQPIPLHHVSALLHQASALLHALLHLSADVSLLLPAGRDACWRAEPHLGQVCSRDEWLSFLSACPLPPSARHWHDAAFVLLRHTHHAPRTISTCTLVEQTSAAANSENKWKNGRVSRFYWVHWLARDTRHCLKTNWAFQFQRNGENRKNKVHF